MTGPISPTAPFNASAYPPSPDALGTLPDGMRNVAAGMQATIAPQTDQAKKAAKERKVLMLEARDAYNGNFPDQLAPQADGRNDNVKQNRCQAIVDTGVDFVFGMPLKIEVQKAKQSKTAVGTPGERAQAGETPLQDAAQACWGNPDDTMTLLTEIAQSGAICGHAFVKILTPADTHTDHCRLSLLNPQQVQVITDPDDCKVADAYLIEHLGVDPRNHQQIVKRQVIARVDPDSDAVGEEDDDANGSDADATWRITNWQRSVQAAAGLDDLSGWSQVGPAITWPYPFAPVVDCPNMPNDEDYWGRPDLTPDLIALNRALHFVESNEQRIIKIYAHPKMWAVGVKASQIDIAPGGIIALHNPEAKLAVLSTPADLLNVRACADDLRIGMDEQSQIPGAALGRMKELPRGGISGITMRAIYQPALMRTAKKRRLYGRLIREATARMLVIMGQVDSTEQVDVTLHWEEFLPDDDLPQAQAALIWEQLGVSQDTLMQEAGYNPDSENDKKAQEGARQMTAFSRGQGMPPALPPPGAPGSPPAVPAAPGQPPIDHPAAVAQRAAVAATAKP